MQLCKFVAMLCYLNELLLWQLILQSYTTVFNEYLLIFSPQSPEGGTVVQKCLFLNILMYDWSI